MKIHYSMDDLGTIHHPVVTTGTFDGVHAGHTIIINRLIVHAREIGGESVLITFHPHPRRVLYPEAEGKNLLLINSQEEKKKLLARTGLDHLIILEFTREFARTTCTEFVEKYLVGRLQASVIVVGFNHYFGYNKRGDFSYLYKLRDRYHFRVEEIPHHDIQNETVSSTKIRKALLEGNIQRANAYLNHYYMIIGRLRADLPRSYHSGHKTYDVDIKERIKLIPANGIYAVSIHFRNTIRKALFRVDSFGIEKNYLSKALSMTLVPLDPSLILDNERVVIYFHKKIRERDFDADETLNARQLETDLREIEALIY